MQLEVGLSKEKSIRMQMDNFPIVDDMIEIIKDMANTEEETLEELRQTGWTPRA
ncbi:hypothetical protein KSX_96030 [Ktedonospora formicarum]|uniref:Uncharacterized protein n=1 Tax=Ktedonospora formicarum TaxID=2778364 RepID=A0A8J3N046_9CHLR|nr:hypothetical protein KSX_96030 [Ktedonospora formicarum]